MCLAIPMRVEELAAPPQGFEEPVTALVDADGMKKEVRLDLADRIPEPGDYVIVHAGFVIRTLSEEEALANLRLMREMAEAGLRETDGKGEKS